MTPEERFEQIETLLKLEQEQAVKRGQEIDKQNDAIRSLIVVARTCLDSFQEIRDVQRKDREDWLVTLDGHRKKCICLSRGT